MYSSQSRRLGRPRSSGWLMQVQVKAYVLAVFSEREITSSVSHKGTIPIHEDLTLMTYLPPKYPTSGYYHIGD